jgi:hypothetical protein
VADAISPLRGEVIEKTINVEWLMHAIISQHYFGHVRLDFVSEVLYDESFPFALKRRILLKICPDLQGKVENQLNRLNTIRNFFAHVGQSVVDGLDPKSPARIPSPRDFTESVNFDVLYREFLAIEGPLTKALFATYEKKGGLSGVSAT